MKQEQGILSSYMKNRWAGSLIFIGLFMIALLAMAKMFPYDNSNNHPLNRILPLGGVLFGQEPEAWVGDRMNEKIVGQGRPRRSAAVDVDFIKVRGWWYKIKGPVYITRGGRILGWHRKMTLEEADDLGKWGPAEFQNY